MTTHRPASADRRRSMGELWPLLGHFPVTSVMITPHRITIVVVGADAALSLSARLGADDDLVHMPSHPGAQNIAIRGYIDGTPTTIIGSLVSAGGVA